MAAPAQAALPRLPAWTIRYIRTAASDAGRRRPRIRCRVGSPSRARCRSGGSSSCARRRSGTPTHSRGGGSRIAPSPCRSSSRRRSTPAARAFLVEAGRRATGSIPEVSGSKPTTARSPRTCTSFCQPLSVYWPGRTRTRGVGDVEDLQPLAHRPDEGVVVEPVVGEARLELDVRSDEAADVRDVRDVLARPAARIRASSPKSTAGRGCARDRAGRSSPPRRRLRRPPGRRPPAETRTRPDSSSTGISAFIDTPLSRSPGPLPADDGPGAVSALGSASLEFHSVYSGQKGAAAS